jgi:outer membrane protein assembly factor BamE (lipoprotein component of BamABCDE complex)
MCTMRRPHTLFVRLTAAALLASTVAGCLGSEEFQRGYLVDERAVAQVSRGMSAEQVLQTLGTPSTVSTVGNKNWYYISQVSRRTFQFAGETVVDQRVTAVYFDSRLRVERVALYGIQDGKVFDFVSRTTPTGGEDLNFVGQLFRGTTKFNPFGT